MEYVFDMEEEDNIFETRLLDLPIQKILSLTYEPFYDSQNQTSELHTKSLMKEEQTSKETDIEELSIEQPLMTTVQSRPTLNIKVLPEDRPNYAPSADKCRDYAKYMINKIIDMLYVRTDIAQKQYRRKTVYNYSSEAKRNLSQDEIALCLRFLEETKKNHNFQNIRNLFGVITGQLKENKTADAFRLESFRYFSSRQASFDYVVGEMNFINKLSVIKKLNKMCEMCIAPDELNTLNE